MPHLAMPDEPTGDAWHVWFECTELIRSTPARDIAAVLEVVRNAARHEHK
jgi:hypothetical protein